MTVELLGLPRDALARHLDGIGVGAAHAPAVFRALHRDAVAPAAVPGLGRHTATLAASGYRAEARVVGVHDSDDGTRKLVVALADGARVEAVLLPMRPGRATLCVSSQVGCAMACTFCATGTMGLTRHLSAGEIVAQVHAASAAARDAGTRVARLVFMGMGEPLHNEAAVTDAVRVLLDDLGAGLGSRQIVVSTVGLPERLVRFAAAFDGRVGMALSLHAGTDAVRQQIVPLARKVSLATLRQTVLDIPTPRNRKWMMEYVVLPGLNDTEAELDGVAAFMRDIPGVVNLIPFNPFPGAPWRSPTFEELLALYLGLRGRGVAATVRRPRGRDQAGACGQLALAHERAGRAHPEEASCAQTS